MRQEDSVLLERYSKSADQRAFEEVVNRYGGLVMGTALRKVSQRERAEEICQNVFAILARKAERLSSYTGGGSLASWLHRSTVLEANNFLRSDRTRRQRMLEYQEAHQHASAPEAGEQLEALIDDAIQSLDEFYRRLVIMRFFEGLTHTEIAEQIGKSGNAVQKQIARSLNKLSAFLTDKGTVVPGAVLSSLLIDSLKGESLTKASVQSLAASARTQSLQAPTTSVSSPPAHAMSYISRGVLAVAIVALLLAGGLSGLYLYAKSNFESGLTFAGGAGDGGTPAQTAELSAQARAWFEARGYEMVASPAVAEERLGTLSRGAYEAGSTTWMLPGSQHFFVITEQLDMLEPDVTVWAKGWEDEVFKHETEALYAMAEFQNEIMSQYPNNNAERLVVEIREELERQNRDRKRKWTPFRQQQ